MLECGSYAIYGASYSCGIHRLSPGAVREGGPAPSTVLGAGREEG